MKKNIFLFAATVLVITGIQSCDKIKDAVFQAFTANTAEVTFTVTATSDTSNVMTLGNQTVHFNLDSTIQAETDNNFSLDDISTVKLEEVTATILNPDASNNFANFQKVKLIFSSNSNTTPFTLTDITNNPDTYAATLVMPVDQTVNLKSYMSGTEWIYNATGKLRRATTHDLNIKIVMKVKVDN